MRSLILILFVLSASAYERASSYPYLSGDTWRFFADWTFSTGESKFDPSKVRLGDIVFVDQGRLKRFFHKYLGKIKYRFILITSNNETDSDESLPGRFSYALKNRQLAVWVTQNIDCAPSQKVIPIPIGLANQVWEHGQISVLTPQIEQMPPPGDPSRTRLLLCNFSVRTNPAVRAPCLDYFQNRLNAAVKVGRSFDEYLTDLSETLFVVSPPGNGLDCHRTWEALLMGCYPIVLSTTLDPLYQDLPVVIVRDWSEVTEGLLRQKQSEFTCRSWSLEKLYAPYWFEKVRSIQKDLRENPTLLERFSLFWESILLLFVGA